MCNSVHAESKPIPSFGIGYKLVRDRGGKLYTLVFCRRYIQDQSGYTYWDTAQACEIGEGFCFFRSLKEAEKALRVWIVETNGCITKDIKIIKIFYEGGIEEHKEESFCGELSWNVSLCKRWKEIRFDNFPKEIK